jgi:hypothetical protein
MAMGGGAITIFNQEYNKFIFTIIGCAKRMLGVSLEGQ